MHLWPGWEIPKDYYTQASTSTEALIFLTAPKQVHLLGQRGHRRWPAFKMPQPGRVTHARSLPAPVALMAWGASRAWGAAKGAPASGAGGTQEWRGHWHIGAALFYYTLEWGLLRRGCWGRVRWMEKGYREPIAAGARVSSAVNPSSPTVAPLPHLLLTTHPLAVPWMHPASLFQQGPPS